ncbi:hypothetical protein E3N88_41928 [Mikania micrantha]|uniref:Uncharacterized protein n=1 Tax=Mikania micrantha TaxID=192012 RepID=A0A5N6LJ87_9ASTR|nr:hypothetical protein E3N88_41928 [Mikania micrantha]
MANGLIRWPLLPHSPAMLPNPQPPSAFPFGRQPLHSTTLPFGHRKCYSARAKAGPFDPEKEPHSASHVHGGCSRSPNHPFHSTKIPIRPLDHPIRPPVGPYGFLKAHYLWYKETSPTSDETGVQSSEATNRPVLPNLNEEVAGQTSYWQFDLNQEPCVDEDVNRECYAGEQSHPPQVAVKDEEADIVYQNMDCNTNEIFISVEELMAWVKSRPLDNGYVVVTGRSKKKKGTDEVRNDKHNHEPAQNPEGHPFVKRLSEHRQNMVHHLTRQHMEPRNILSSIKKQNPDNVSIRRDVFPHASRYLCRWHISENIAKHCKESFSDGDWKKFKGRWGNLCDSSSLEIYDYNYNRLYEQLVADNRQSFVDQMVESQEVNMKHGFETSLIKIMGHHKLPMFNNLRDKVSHKALDLLLDEINKIKVTHQGNMSCSHQLWLAMCLSGKSVRKQESESEANVVFVRVTIQTNTREGDAI